MTGVAGLLLAAGAGRRFGGPKALAELGGVPLVRRAVRVLAAGGCAPILVVVGAAADEVSRLVADEATAVPAPDWETGMGASLRAGMAAVAVLDPVPVAVLVHLVDLPGVGPEAVARVASHARPAVLARADYGSGPGHPVLCGRDWWPQFAAGARGDRGARDFLAAHPDVQLVDCADLGSGEDADTPDALR